MKFIRYELSFFGEKQNIGFIQGLKEQEIPDISSICTVKLRKGAIRICRQ